MKFKKILISLGFLFVLFVPLISSAAILDNTLIVEAQDCSKGCSLNTFMKLGINIAHYILGIVGALTLLMFIFGGFTWILSGGSSDKVQKGKDIIIGSVVGLLIVFSSYMIINFVSVNLLGGTFNDTITDEKKTETNKKDCVKDYNGYCQKNNLTCKQISGVDVEASIEEGCPKDQKCCYKKGNSVVKNDCINDAGGSCGSYDSCTTGTPNANLYCSNPLEVCCLPPEPDEGEEGE